MERQMPRQPRLDLAGMPQHILQRGNDRRPCFFQGIDHVRSLCRRVPPEAAVKQLDEAFARADLEAVLAFCEDDAVVVVERGRPARG